MRHLIVPDSDIIEAIGYDAEAIEVVFKSTPDVVYRYENVPGGVFAALCGAESIGKKFHELFRKTKYPFTKSVRQKSTLKK